MQQNMLSPTVCSIRESMNVFIVRRFLQINILAIIQLLCYVYCAGSLWKADDIARTRILYKLDMLQMQCLTNTQRRPVAITSCQVHELPKSRITISSDIFTMHIYFFIYICRGGWGCELMHFLLNVQDVHFNMARAVLLCCN